MAGVAGLEPANAGVKVPCLTTWLHPSIAGSKKGKARSGRSGPSALRLYGVGDGTRTRDTRNHNPMLYQLNYTHHRNHDKGKLARLKGLEPLTHCLEGSCSIHLSYRRVWSG